jgi:hypothetical protein
MKHTHVVVLVCLSMLYGACSTYRVVPFARGVDEDGNILQFYAVAHNNVIIPEYVINERGEYPTDEATAWERFHSRKDEWVPKMQVKYEIPSNGVMSVKQSLLGLGFLAVSPISYPIYAMSSEEGESSVADYFDVMVNGSSAQEPELRDELANF